ncbi:hypothetical protein, partial [Lysobacter claricitrinus]|uniref:hypothetical protein n=1 Tax=Lysobacter claricitrinus TaxID=3367728 RepID=UPI0038B2BA94
MRPKQRPKAGSCTVPRDAASNYKHVSVAGCSEAQRDLSGAAAKTAEAADGRAACMSPNHQNEMLQA